MSQPDAPLIEAEFRIKLSYSEYEKLIENSESFRIDRKCLQCGNGIVDASDGTIRCLELPLPPKDIEKRLPNYRSSLRNVHFCDFLCLKTYLHQNTYPFPEK